MRRRENRWKLRQEEPVPGKIYEVQGSPDLAGFSPLTDIAGASDVLQTTLAAPSAGEDQYFFRVQEDTIVRDSSIF